MLLGISQPLCRGLLGPLGPKCQKGLENVSRGSGPARREASKKSWALRDSPRRPRQAFSRLFGISGPECLRDSCKGRANSQEALKGDILKGDI